MLTCKRDIALRKTKRLQAVTVASLMAKGARSYAWLNPGEKLPGMSQPLVAGAFAYTFEPGASKLGAGRLEAGLAGLGGEAFEDYFPQKHEGCYFPIAL